MKNIFLSVFLLFHFISPAQETDKPEKYEYYIKILDNAKDSLYKSILESYDKYVEKHPDDYLVQIERCRLIDNAYSEDDEEYNPNYEEGESCTEELATKFPHIPEVMLFKAESAYGDSGKEYLIRVLDEFEADPEKWKDKGIWKIYKQLGEIYGNEKKHSNAIKYGELAVSNNDTLDLSLFLAREYNEVSEIKKAVQILESNLDSTDEPWELGQKGKLLLELGAPEKAMVAYRYAKNDSTAFVDNDDLSRALIENGLYEEARECLVKDLDSEWKRESTLQKIFNYDLKYGSVDSAHASYKEFVKGNFKADPFGIYRLRLFFHDPFFAWSFFDVLRIILLFLVVVAILLVPYVLILPIHFVGSHFLKRGMIVNDSGFRWTLRHFWYICSLVLLVDVFGSFIFTLYGDGAGESIAISKNIAAFTLYTFTGYLISAMLLIKRPDLKKIRGQLWDMKKSILVGIGMAFVLRLGLGVYLKIIHALGINNDMPLCFTSITDNIISINKFYHPVLGFLLVVIAVPLYEEIIFRGIILSACERYMKYFLANSLQAAGFALLHQDMILFPFFFAFGILGGYYRKKSKSLVPGISMHMTNNLFAFITIAAKS